MTPQEEGMLEEINELHAKLAASERGRLKWMGISILSFIVSGVLLWFTLRA